MDALTVPALVAGIIAAGACAAALSGLWGHLRRLLGLPALEERVTALEARKAALAEEVASLKAQKADLAGQLDRLHDRLADLPTSLSRRSQRGG